MTTVYYKSISSHRDLHGLELLSPARQAKGETLKSIDDKARNLVAGLLLRCVFGEKSLEIVEDEKGKPCLPGHHFNLSHSGEFVVLAVSDHPVGVDIQCNRPYKIDLVKYFSPEEQAQTHMDFFHLWTAKEALGKALGIGLTKEILKTNLLSGHHDNFSFSWHDLEHYTLCVASQDSHISLISPCDI